MGMRGVVPKTSPERIRKYAHAMLDSFKEFEVMACHDLSEGGLAVAVAEMCIASGIGAKIDLSEMNEETYTKLFSESNTRWLVELKAKDLQDYIEFFKSKGLVAHCLGYTGGDEIEFKDGRFNFKVSLKEADKAWRTGLTRYTGW
jgi:phosphoribosylformylglycinamidine synthase